MKIVTDMRHLWVVVSNKNGSILDLTVGIRSNDHLTPTKGILC